ncbi:MAG: adenylate/guanylate cyclase domain-containing protein [Candidatus Eremiobacteraeota bacterium]|nr:adenylate/guanylate cyclase domain-containing protein [Candidatus Eremiobacteraeota bacterium]
MSEQKTGHAKRSGATAPADARHQGVLLATLVAVLLLGLPLAVWLDLRSLTASALHRQASDLDSVITGVRGFYTTDIVDRVRSSRGQIKVIPNYHAVRGAIPIPATFSLQLGHIVNEHQGNISYRFVSDFPFKHRAPHKLDDFERQALAALRAQKSGPLTSVSWNGLSTHVRYVTPIVMSASCVACHNSNPDSPKRDWKIGDVRGIQEVSITQPFVGDVFSFKYLLLYFVFAGCLGLGFIALQRRQAGLLAVINGELTNANDFLASISIKISRYLSPQVYKSIFTGQTDTSIHTTRKKLTIFFSDIKDFTSTTEQLQPEELTALLNEYFTEMSNIALSYGGTIDKFVGDAILVFFGDPETKGVSEDARCALRTAVEMQRRLVDLNVKWRNRGVAHPFKVRMGINTGFCNVGNFGSNDRMDYTIIGAEANLAARLQSIAEPGSIVISYETYALVRDIVSAHKLAPISMKGISREVTPYAVDGLLDAAGQENTVVNEHVPGLDLYLDLGMVDDKAALRAREALREALAALEAHKRGGWGPADG